MSIFKMPSFGADMESGILMEWKVKEGDHVKKDQVIAEVETSKGVIATEVFEEGIIEKILVEPGTECAVGMPLALIRTKNESSEDLEKALAELTLNDKKEVSKEQSKDEKKQTLKERKAKSSTIETAKISPAARKKARELGVDIELLASKTDGKIGLEQVEAAAAKTQEIKPDGMRHAIAKAMSRSNAEIPHYYLSISINMTPALEWLEAQNKKRSIKDRILSTALVIRAVVKTLQEVPELNGFWKDDALQISDEIHPGIAIALRKGGLITPALIDAQNKNLDQTMTALHDLITRARSGKLRSSEMTKQTIVITNLGDIGVERVYGVIYPPQVALVGLGRISNAPWVEGDTLVVQKVMQATLAGDHRATDGRTGALFLDKLNQILQKPEELL
ncbi:MAG: dihydrolipoamide acetyltransferase family protein [Sulfurospirillaceae bacterium]|nr:dihydrolipoamide acetyltransferase family protein [Sulfurospirillaceae bacterium]